MTVPSLPCLKPPRNLAKQRPGGGPPPAWAQQIITSHSSPPHLALLVPRRTLIAHRDSLALYTGNLWCSQGRAIARLAAKGGSTAESDSDADGHYLCCVLFVRVAASRRNAPCCCLFQRRVRAATPPFGGSGAFSTGGAPAPPVLKPERRRPPRRRYALAAGASRLCYGLVGAPAARPDHRPCAGALSCSPCAPPKRQSWALLGPSCFHSYVIYLFPKINCISKNQLQVFNCFSCQ